MVMLTSVQKIIKCNERFPWDLKSKKFLAMAADEFGFYRGTCHLFANDFMANYKVGQSVKTWICGDIHFENFGSYKAETRQVYFDINDFDESILGIPEIDISRFITSIIIAGRLMKADEKLVKTAVSDLINVYADKLLLGKALIMEKEVAHGVFKKYFNQLEKRNRVEIVNKLTQKREDKLSLKIDGIHLLAIDTKEKQILYKTLGRFFKGNTSFQHVQFVDAAFRIAGTGSLGLKRYCILCYHKARGKYYFIDVKQSRRSCYAQYKQLPKQPKFANESERIINGQWVMEFCTPDFFAPLKIDKEYYIVKELQPKDDKMTLEGFSNDFNTLSIAAREMAALVAYAHLRSSGHNTADNADKLMAFASKKKWKQELITLCYKLADNNARYYSEFKSYIKNDNKYKIG